MIFKPGMTIGTLRTHTLIVVLLVLILSSLTSGSSISTTVGGDAQPDALEDTTLTRQNANYNTTYPPGEIEWKVDLSRGTSGSVGMPAVADLDGDGYVETLVVGDTYDNPWYDYNGEYQINYSSELHCLDHQGNVRWKFLLSDFWFSSSTSPVVCDLDNDGELEILIGGQGEYAYDIEGVLYCLDKDANVKWRRNYTAYWSYSTPAVGDLNGDSKLEIVYTTWNTMICLDHSGEELWSVTETPITDFGYSPTIADLYNDGHKHVLVESWGGMLCFDGDPSDGVDEGVQNAGLIDSKGGADLLWYQKFESEYYKRWYIDSVTVADVVGNGRKEIITSEEMGKVACLNADGNVIWESNRTGLQAAPVVGDMNGDGTEEILALMWAYDWWYWDEVGIATGSGTGSGTGTGTDTSTDSGGSRNGSRQASETDADGDGSTDDIEPRPEPQPEPWPREEFNVVCFDASTGEELWYYPLSWWGEVLILGDADGDGDLEVFMSSEETIIALDGDEDENGRIDEEEFLWQFKSGWIYGWSNSFALADVDHDGQLELIVTANEIMYCLSVGGKCPKGTIEWGKVYFDLENTNHYISGIRSGVKIYPKSAGGATGGSDGHKRTMVKYGEIGEIVSFEMQVKNTGRYDAYYGPSGGVEFYDTFTLEALNLPAGWWATFDVIELRLAPQQVADIVMEVQIPYSAYSKASANIKALAFAQKQPWVNDTQETVTIVKSQYNLRLSCSDPIRGDGVPANDEPLTPFDTALFRITLTNLGSLNDTVLVAIDTPSDTQWQAGMNLPTPEGKPTVNLGSGEARDFFVFVTIPEDAGAGEYAFNITATSLNEPEIFDALVLTVKVDAFVASIYLICNESQHYIRPGGEVTYTITVLNYLNEPATVDLGLAWALPSFNATQNISELTVRPGENAAYNVTVTAPLDALADVLCSVQLTASWRADPRVFDTLTLWAVVEHIYDLSFTLASEYHSIMPGNGFAAEFTVTNLGNGYDHYTLAIANISGAWGRELSGYPSTLDPRTHIAETLGLNITLPLRTVTGTYLINLTCTSESGKKLQRTMTVFVEEYFGIQVAVLPQLRAGGPGKEVRFQCTLTNLGNGPRTFTATVPNPQQFAVTFGSGMLPNQPAVVALDPFEQHMLPFNVTIPRAALLRVYNFTFYTAMVTEPQTTIEDVWNRTFFLIQVTSPDLILDDAKLDGDSVRQGQLVSVRAKVTNLGNAPAENVTVAIYERGSTIPLATQHFEVVYGTQDVYLQWLVKSSGTSFEIKVDPDNVVEEIDENNNVREFAYHEYYIAAPGFSFAELIILFVLLCTGLLVPIAAYTAYKRRQEL